jgi:predicted HAD superfamily Cof-like phosphohydrolase
MVREFHEKFGLPIRDTPDPCSDDERYLREGLIREEFSEYMEASYDADIIGIADALADLAYVVYGAALTHGIDLDAVLAEVHRSNMAKLQADGSVRRRADGKVLKPEGWTPPNIAEVLGV